MCILFQQTTHHKCVFDYKLGDMSNGFCSAADLSAPYLNAFHLFLHLSQVISYSLFIINTFPVMLSNIQTALLDSHTISFMYTHIHIYNYIYIKL